MTNSQAGHLYIQMLRSAKPAHRPDLRNRLVGDIPNPRMIANSVVRLSIISLRWSQAHITKKAGQGRSGIHPFLPCPLITTLTILSAAVWQLPVLS